VNRALFARNAAACESAKGSTCRCACGGALHGRKHSAEWIAKTIAERERLEDEGRAAALAELERFQLTLPQIVGAA
jgi:hypothetical protein